MSDDKAILDQMKKVRRQLFVLQDLAIESGDAFYIDRVEAAMKALYAIKDQAVRGRLTTRGKK